MAQVLIDQSINSGNRYNRGFYQRPTELITSEEIGHESSTVSSRLRKRFAVPSAKKISLDIKQSSCSLVQIEESIDCIELDDSRSCDDPIINPNESEDIASDNVVESTESKKVKGFSCTVCGHVASSSNRLREHLSRHTGMKHFECEICGKKFAWRYSFSSHMASHKEDNPNKCTICGKKYCTKSAVKYHMKRIHGNPIKEFKCEKCDKNYVTKAELDRHLFKHSEEKPFICEYCGKMYRFKGALIVHYRIHSGEKPYKCSFCDKSFIHLSSAIGHRRRHTGEMPFQCNECGKMFRVKRAMTAHMSVHSEKRPFKCNKCEKSFKSRSGYRVHLDFHLGVKRHTCKYCGKTFRAWCNMHKHIRRHLGDKPHKCDLCGKTFIEKQELKCHMKSHEEKNTKKVPISQNIVPESCNDVISASALGCSSPDIDTPSAFTDAPQSSEMIQSHIDISDNQAVMYDCNLPNSLDKCQTEKCQLLQDSYVSQFLYPQHPPVQYASQPMPIQNMYSSNEPTLSSRSACLSNMNSNFNCVSLNNQNYNFSYLPNSEGLLLKCKLCRSLFHSTLVLRGHLLEYHRIEEENVDELLA